MKSVKFEVLLLKQTGKSKTIESSASMEDAQRFIKSWNKQKPDDELVISCIWPVGAE